MLTSPFFRFRVSQFLKKNSSSETAVLIIDMQDNFLNSKEKQALIRNQIAVLRKCRKLNIPVVAIKYRWAGKITRPLREEIDAFQKNGVFKITKSKDDAFLGTKLYWLLKKIKVQKIIIMGVNECTCVFETANHAFNLGFNLITSKDLMAGYCGAPSCNPEKRLQWYKKNTCYDSLSSVMAGL